MKYLLLLFSKYLLSSFLLTISSNSLFAMSQTVYSKDIFYGLPTFPNHDGKKYTAVVTGANGITGAHLIRVLSAAPERWETIYALSRRVPSGPTPPNVKYLAIDFLKKPEEIAKELREGGVKKV